MIRPALAADAAAIARIYRHYVDHTIITFEEETPTAADYEARIADTVAAGLPWLVIEEAGSVVGWAYASKWKGRCAYRYSAETSIYLAPGATGHGLGVRLYTTLLAELITRGMHAAIGGVSLPNAASVALHEKLGFEKVAQFREVGFKLGRWIDVGYWQRML